MAGKTREDFTDDEYDEVYEPEFKRINTAAHRAFYAGRQRACDECQFFLMTGNSPVETDGSFYAVRGECRRDTPSIDPETGTATWPQLIPSNYDSFKGCGQFTQVDREEPDEDAIHDKADEFTRKTLGIEE